MLRQHERGQASADLLVSLTLVVLVTYGTVQISFLAITRHAANYAAFSASRSALVHGSASQSQPRAASRDAMRQFLPLGTLENPTTAKRGKRRGIVVPFYLPLGTLLYPDQDPRGIRVEGFAVAASQGNVPEVGDNAR